tara:strand:- start:3033 stop:3428 length:396 start_codon:yes stop_codon:yes gene_type:complete
MEDYEKAAMLVYLRKARFIEDYNPYENIFEIVNKHFGDIKLIEKYGIESFFNSFTKILLKENFIGLILLGKVSKKLGSTIINSYRLNDRPEEVLSVSTICSIILDEYLSKKEIKDLCFNTPNFNIYYKKNN